MITEFIIILFGDIPPLSMIEGAFLKYLGIPVALTWLMSQKTFDGKKPYSFLTSQITYALRPKITYAGKAVKLHKQTLNRCVEETVIRDNFNVRLGLGRISELGMGCCWVLM